MVIVHTNSNQIIQTSKEVKHLLKTSLGLHSKSFDKNHEIITYLNTERPNFIIGYKTYLLFQLNPLEYQTIKKKNKKAYKSLKRKIEAHISKKDSEILSENILGKTVNIFVSTDQLSTIKKFTSQIISFQGMQYFLVYDYKIEDKKETEINLIELSKDFKNYQNLCNYQITI